MDLRNRTASEDGRYKFTGKERDASTGLDYFGARYYDSWRGGWDQVDPLSDDHPDESPYVYCSGNPINIVDDDGMEGHWETGPDGNPIWVLDPVVATADGGNSNKAALAVGAAASFDLEPISKTILTAVFFTYKTYEFVDKYASLLNIKGLKSTTNPNTNNLPAITINMSEEQNKEQGDSKAKSKVWQSLKPFRGPIKTNGKSGKRKRYYK
jgi:RHS repeat-associated protein